MNQRVEYNSESLSNYIRYKSLQMTHKGSTSHIGSILSCADIIAVLYSEIINIGNSDKSLTRDRFVMSKGHAGAGLYACLARLDLIPEVQLESHYQDGSRLSGHVSHKLLPHIEMSTGSLGHGLPLSCGIALALKLKGISSKVFCLMSDGELDEGSNWESMLFASHHNLSNIKVIIDRNKLQSIKSTEETLSLEPLIDKFKSFNWEVSNINGHSHELLKRDLTYISDKPHIIIANTIKGKGVSFMENSVLWHYRSPNNDELEQALQEIEK